jgi:hypothetical protein
VHRSASSPSSKSISDILIGSFHAPCNPGAMRKNIGTAWHGMAKFQHCISRTANLLSMVRCFTATGKDIVLKECHEMLIIALYRWAPQ